MAGALGPPSFYTHKERATYDPQGGFAAARRLMFMRNDPDRASHEALLADCAMGLLRRMERTMDQYFKIVTRPNGRQVLVEFEHAGGVSSAYLVAQKTVISDLTVCARVVAQTRQDALDYIQNYGDKQAEAFIALLEFNEFFIDC